MRLAVLDELISSPLVSSHAATVAGDRRSTVRPPNEPPAPGTAPPVAAYCCSRIVDRMSKAHDATGSHDTYGSESVSNEDDTHLVLFSIGTSSNTLRNSGDNKRVSSVRFHQLLH